MRRSVIVDEVLATSQSGTCGGLAQRGVIG